MSGICTYLETEISDLHSKAEKTNKLLAIKKDIRQRKSSYSTIANKSTYDRFIYLIDVEIEYLKNLSNENISGKNITVGRIGDRNKPALNQVQISILFRLMFEFHTFIRKDLPKNQLSAYISGISGYSAETIRQNLSIDPKDFFTLTDNPDDYKNIITELNKILKEVKILLESLPND